MDERLKSVLEAVDALNREDPRSVDAAGEKVPYELLYSQRMSEWLERISEDASDALKIAVRAQHIQRWKIPRDDFPEGRKGYHRWRNELAAHHAQVTGTILRAAGYESEMIENVANLLRKKNLKSDAEAQTLEDVACLVFLEHYFEDFSTKHSEEKIIGIIKKTWAKMSEAAQKHALELELPEHSRALIERALKG